MSVLLDEETKSQILTAAFCGYIMSVRKCSKEEALGVMAQLCTAVQIMIGLGDKGVGCPK